MMTTPCRAFAPHVLRSSGPPPAAATVATLPPANLSPTAASPADEDNEWEDKKWRLSTREWRSWGTTSLVPSMVAQVIEDMKALEEDTDANARFGGFGSKFQGEFRIHEDKKHRAVYEALTDSEQKLQFFSARQIACRLLGSRGYLCQKCWLAMEDCMCSQLVPCSIWPGIRFWLYMHPKDFLRQNNTGKLLWQIFGAQAATLCLFGIQEHEKIMWDALRHSGKDMVWFLYPNKSTSIKSVRDAFFDVSFTGAETRKMDHSKKNLNFVLIDGTWSNSSAMYRRLKDKWASIWGEEDPPCVSLSPLAVSAMHKLRPQPAWDRTCTAAAAAGLLYELHQHPDLKSLGLDKQAESLEVALDVLLDALTTRRLRMGRSITRRDRKSAAYRLIQG